MKTLLLVESDRHTRHSLVSAVSGMSDELRVLSARDGEQAARLLASDPVDILVTQLVMPVMDGFELLNFVLAEYPEIEIVAMGETRLGRASQALCAAGVSRYLSKPVAADDLIGVVRSILARPAKGRLTGLSLPGFLQLLSAERRTCCLRVKVPGHEGRVDMSNGQLINASWNGIEGKPALFETLSWVDPEIEVEEPRENAARLIDERLPSLLLEAALEQDMRISAAVSKARAPSGDLPDSLAPTASGRPGRADSDQELGPGGLMGAFRTFAAVPLHVEAATAAKGLRAFMRLEGTLGAGILEFETGRSLAHVCRGRNRYFAEIAADAARSVREGMRKIGDPDLRESVCQLKLLGPRQFQLVRVMRGQPRLLLIFMGLVGRADVTAASDLLANFEDAILGSSDPRSPRAPGPD
ncbi:MAG: response regulator [Acidobacteriota bacterium]|nr:response regulator [Acidobacteriota bacterium]MDH3522514.1 response regulator [Acidobacteriota bacterium]